MNEAGLRARLCALPPATLPSSVCCARPPNGAIPAAVLVGITLGEKLNVLLTKRAGTLRCHAGQVSFPGGRIEPFDPTPAAAALREAREEIGLDSDAVDLLGRLPDHTSGSGFRIIPVVALIAPRLHLSPAPAEVEAVFALPVASLLDEAQPLQQTAERGGKLRTYWVWPHPDYEIWGATAAILLSLAAILRKAPPRATVSGRPRNVAAP